MFRKLGIREQSQGSIGFWVRLGEVAVRLLEVTIRMASFNKLIEDLIGYSLVWYALLVVSDADHRQPPILVQLFIIDFLLLKVLPPLLSFTLQSLNQALGWHITGHPLR